VLAELVGGGVAVEPVSPTGIGEYGGCQLAAVGSVDEEGTNGVRAVVHPDNEIVFYHMAEAFFLKFAGCGNSCQINIYFFVFKNKLWSFRFFRAGEKPPQTEAGMVVRGVGRLFAVER
jgi:hypothetical protein